MVRYFKTRNGLRFYAIESGGRKKVRWALSNLNHSTIGRIVRLRITAETIRDELVGVTPSKVPVEWRESFARFFWRSKL
jgi:hypothetical protein